MKTVKKLLIPVLATLTITGISALDGFVWSVIVLVGGELTYVSVGGLYAKKLISGKGAGKIAYKIVFVLFILSAVGMYFALSKFRNWVLMWPFGWKVAAPIILALAVICMVISWVVIKVKK